MSFIGTPQMVIPYIKGISKQIRIIYAEHGVQTSMRLLITIKNFLVHLKDKLVLHEMC